MRRAKWGIGAIVIAGAAWLLMNLLNFDLGGLGRGQYALVESDGSRTETDDSQDAEREPIEKVADDRMVSTANPEAAIGGDGTVDVRVEERNYYLRGGQDAQEKWVPASLDAVVAAAKRAPGDEAGIRVRVLRGGSSRAGAEATLIDALRAAGIESSQLIVPDVETPQAPVE